MDYARESKRLMARIQREERQKSITSFQIKQMTQVYDALLTALDINLQSLKSMKTMLKRMEREEQDLLTLMIQLEEQLRRYERENTTNPVGNPVENPVGNPVDNPVGNSVDNPVGNSVDNPDGV